MTPSLVSLLVVVKRVFPVTTALLTAAIIFSPLALSADEPESPKSENKDDAKPDKEKKEEPEIKPYEKVITKDTKTDEGVFKVHRNKAKVLYEIPAAELGKEFLWVTQIAKTTFGRGYGGAAAGNRVVRWERRENRVLLRGISYGIVADPALPVAKAVEAANYNPIIMAFPIEALGPNDAPVIDVTKLFTTEIPEFSVRSALRAKGFDSARSYVERAVSFPLNIEIEATQTYTAPPDDGGASRPSGPTRAGEPPSMRPGAASVLVHYSMVKLPDQPMRPRLRDERVGFFSITQNDFGQDEHRAPKRTYITRYRLDKKDPNAGLSDPVKPIVYWIDPATPKKWVSFIKRGIEDWQPAFEAAGFKNAIVAREAPSPQEDPDWSPEDARYSVIRWLPSTVANASGPHIHDPRTGEIIEADIQLHQNVMNLCRNWYFVQAGPLDPRANKLPLPDDLMGHLLQYVVTHEVGHTLGFPHNMKSSSLYPVAKIRDRDWVKKMGHVATLMDYARMNYVAQPEDGIDPVDLVPKIGPYDKWATHWGYAPIASAATPDDEKATLSAWAREQDSTPWLRFSTRGEGADYDYGDQTEAVGDADAVESTRLGLKNLERVAAMLIPATTTVEGEPFDDLEELYGNLLSQWSREMGHVIRIVGGFESQQKNAGQEGVLHTPVSRERQKAAVTFINDNAFATPAFVLRPDILRRIEASGTLERIRGNQQRVLEGLLSPTRINRVTEQEAIDGAKMYRAVDLLADVRNGIWRELAAKDGSAAIDAYRRNLQRSWLNLVCERAGAERASDDSRALFRGELLALDSDIGRALPKMKDSITRLHLDDTRAAIKRALDPNRPATKAGSPPERTLQETESGGVWSLDCWPDDVAPTAHRNH